MNIYLQMQLWPHPPIFSLSLLSPHPGGKLNYEAFFDSKVEAKRQDNSYRKFRVLARQADHFPRASHFPDSNLSYEEGKNVTVWCSNDYMGMSKHPDVVEAAM